MSFWNLKSVLVEYICFWTWTQDIFFDALSGVVYWLVFVLDVLSWIFRIQYFHQLLKESKRGEISQVGYEVSNLGVILNRCNKSKCSKQKKVVYFEQPKS